MRNWGNRTLTKTFEFGTAAQNCEKWTGGPILGKFLQAVLFHIVALLACLALPFLMVWAMLHRSSAADESAVLIVRTASIFLLPLSSYMWLLVGSIIVRRNAPSWFCLLVAFFGTVAVEVLLLRAGIWI